MVFSKINSDIEYSESRKIDPEDKGHQSTLYEVKLFDKDIVVCLGKPKYTYASRNLVFYPIYVVSLDNKIEGQIGLFEIIQDKALKIFDEDGDIQISKLGSPLFYDFGERTIRLTKSDVLKYLMQWEKTGKTGDKPVEPVVVGTVDKQDDSDDVMKVKVPETVGSHQVEKVKKILEKGVFVIDESAKQPTTLLEETETEANALKKSYKESSKQPWIQKFMKNNNYKIL